MKIVLRVDVKNIGKKDEMYEVSDGYARNYLFPRGLAVPADTAAMNEVKAKADSLRYKADVEAENARLLAAKIEGRTVVVRAKAGQGGKLFGSVTPKDIAAALAAESIEIDRRKLSTSEKEIKSFGTYEVEAKIAPGIGAKFNCKVEE